MGHHGDGGMPGGLPPSIPLLHCINSTVDYTVGPLYSGHHCDPAGCPVWRGTPNSEVDLYTGYVVGTADCVLIREVSLIQILLYRYREVSL